MFEVAQRVMVAKLDKTDFALELFFGLRLETVALHLLESESQQLELAGTLHSTDVAKECACRVVEAQQLLFNYGVSLLVLLE